MEMDIFQKIENFFTEMGLQWEDCVGVCTDGAAAMTGRTIGFYGRVRYTTNLLITFTHCMIHRKVLVAKKNFFRSSFRCSRCCKSNQFHKKSRS